MACARPPAIMCHHLSPWSHNAPSGLLMVDSSRSNNLPCIHLQKKSKKTCTEVKKNPKTNMNAMFLFKCPRAREVI